MPVPLLDGGHLLFFGIEAARGRALNERAQEFAFRSRSRHGLRADDFLDL